MMGLWREDFLHRMESVLSEYHVIVIDLFLIETQI